MQTVRTKSKTQIQVSCTSEADVRKHRDAHPGYQMSRQNLGPGRILLTFIRVR